MDPTPDLLDAIYRPSVLGPDRQGPRRTLSLALSGGAFLLLGSLVWVSGPGAPAEVRLGHLPTVSFEGLEEAGSPLPPPPPGPATGVGTPGGALEPAAEVPRLPAPDLGTAPTDLPAAPGGGAREGQEGGAPGGTASGSGGGLGSGPGEAGPAWQAPRFDAAYLRNPEPEYPALSRRFREEGRVILRVLVSEAGLPQAVEVRDSSHHPRLDQAALEAVRRWRFLPARKGPEPFAAWVLVPLTFSLEA